jgi:hypothetical protein
MSIFPKLEPKKQGRDEEPRSSTRPRKVTYGRAEPKTERAPMREEEPQRYEKPVRQRNPETDRAVDEWLSHLDKGFEVARSKRRVTREKQSSLGQRMMGQKQIRASPKGMDDWIKKREETWRRI